MDDTPTDIDRHEEMLDRMQTVRTLWECVESRNWAAARGLFDASATLTWAATGERLLDADAIVKVQKIYPEGWHLSVLEVNGLIDGRVQSIVRVDHAPNRFIATSMFRFDGTQIASIDEYWATVEAPPAWRTAEAIGAYERFDAMAAR